MALLGLAPLATGLDAIGDALAAGRRPPSILGPAIRLVGSRAGTSSRPVSPVVAAASGVALASTAVASLLVPGFALGLPWAGADGLVLVLLLLVSARLARLVAVSCGAPADVFDDLATTLPGLVLAPAAAILAAGLAATIAGSTRLDALATTVSIGSGTARGLLAASLALLAIVDRDLGGDHAASAVRGWPVAALQAERMLRFMVFLTLVAIVLPPATAVVPAAGLLPLVVSLPVFAAKIGFLAVLVGLSRPVRAGIRSSALLGAAAFFGALGAVLVAVGQTLE